MTRANKLAFCFAVLLPLLSHGQGNVRLSNDFIVPGTQKRAIVGVQYGPLSKEFGRVEAVHGNGTVFKSGGLVSDGIFSLGATDIPGTQPGGNGSFIIRAWDTRYGATWEMAQSTPWMCGAVEVRLEWLGGGAIPPPLLATVGNFRGVFGIRLTNSLGMHPTVVNSDGSLRIRASSFVETGLQIWSSTDLQHWTEAAPLQVVTLPDVPLFGHAEWNLQPPGPVTFYKVAYWWDGIY